MSLIIQQQNIMSFCDIGTQQSVTEGKDVIIVVSEDRPTGLAYATSPDGDIFEACVVILISFRLVLW